MRACADRGHRDPHGSHHGVDRHDRRPPVTLTQGDLDPSAVVVLDTFTASDGMPLQNRRPELAPSGKTWAVRGGAPLVITGQRAVRSHVG